MTFSVLFHLPLLSYLLLNQMSIRQELFDLKYLIVSILLQIFLVLILIYLQIDFSNIKAFSLFPSPVLTQKKVILRLNEYYAQWALFIDC
jgi:hypothetical protein